MGVHSDGLRRARKLIEKEENWHRGSLHNGGSRGCLAATAFCAIGACGMADVSTNFLYLVVDGSVAKYNDTHTHAEVLAMFDEAIRLAEEAGE